MKVGVQWEDAAGEDDLGTACHALIKTMLLNEVLGLSTSTGLVLTQQRKHTVYTHTDL